MARTAIDSLSIIWKSDLSLGIKRNFFQADVVPFLLYVYTTWTLSKRIEKIAWQQLHQNASNNIDQILEATSRKIAAVRLHIFHHQNIEIRRTNMLDTVEEVRKHS